MSKISVTTISNQGDTKEVPTETVIAGSAKAWVHFAGDGTVAIRDSFNVSSITDLATGNYTVNLTNPLNDISYAVSGTGSSSGFIGFLRPYSWNVSSIGIQVYSYTANLTDVSDVSVQISDN